MLTNEPYVKCYLIFHNIKIFALFFPSLEVSSNLFLQFIHCQKKIKCYLTVDMFI